MELLGLGFIYDPAVSIYQWLSSTNYSFPFKWVIGCSTLLVLLFIGWWRFRSGYKSTPNQNDTIEEWAAVDLKSDVKESLKTQLEWCAENASKADYALNQLDRFLMKIYGPVIAGIESWNTSVLIAWFYPLLFLFATWIITGSASLGTVTFLFPYSNMLSRLFIVLGCLAVVFGFLRMARSSGEIGDFLVRRNLLARRWEDWIEFIVKFVISAAGLIFVVAFQEAISDRTVVSALTNGIAMVGGFLFFSNSIIIEKFTGYFFAFTILSLGFGAVNGNIPRAAVVASGVFFIFVLVGYRARSGFVARFYRVFADALLAVESKIKRGSKVLFVIILWVLYFLIISTAPHWPWNSLGLSIPPGSWQPDSITFVLFFFLGVLPLINAVSDYLSVACTRWFIRKYQNRSWQWGLVVAADIGVAIVLTFFLFACVCKLFAWMEFCGWGVDSIAVQEVFLADPWNSQTSWITLLAVTNLLPTLIHLVLVISGNILGVFVKWGCKREINHLINQLLEDGKGLGKPNARRLYNYLYIDRYWCAAVVSIFMLMLYPLAQLTIWHLLPYILFK